VRATTDVDDASDFLFAFFQNCLALRDWLSPIFGEPKVVQLFEDNPELQLCRDIANMTKHQTLMHSPSSGSQPSIAREYTDPGESWYGGNSRLIILSQGESVDALELAGRCMDLLEGFVRSRDLTVSEP
jgi:hypothetical protein